MKKVHDLDALAADMQAALEDKEFRSIFDRPTIKTSFASVQEENADSSQAEKIFKQLITSSEALDNLGLSKSAEKVMIAVQTLSAEAMEAADEDESDDKDKKEDDNDAKDKKDDKKNKKDEKGKPEEGKKFKEFMKESPFDDGPKKGPKSKK